MVRFKRAYQDDMIDLSSDQICEVRSVNLSSFPSVKSIVYYNANQDWFYSNETPDEIKKNIEESSYATATH